MLPLPPTVILCTLNARYIHASLGLRYLLANMARHGGGHLRARTVLREPRTQAGVLESEFRVKAGGPRPVVFEVGGRDGSQMPGWD